MNKEAYKQSINKQKRDKKTSLCCSICGESSPETLENHHLFSRANSEMTVPLCKNCHAKITSEQNKLSPKIRSKTSSRKNNIRLFLVSVGGILKIIADQLLFIGFEGDFDE
ncbi:HNH endonuclease [Methanolobus mangrovi]|uniref:HNH endonuclease n=1 Tax=Methanolobus mangrovi TaxID=3072977 RepID=A0AA51YJA9_9EURY|nr:HNH endonuclease [Methanolobus mangrovi]WMW22415.1 HNH endonuclease [Methanolobus mangrovi]